VRPFSPIPRRGLTLIELLTVIAIIGILAAIIIPVVGRVRQTARDTQNLSNLRQISVALTLHANENRQQFPFGFDGTLAAGSRTWNTQIAPYVGPRFAERNELFISPNASVPVTDRFLTTYALHPAITQQRLANGSLGLSGLGPFRLNQIPRPSQIILVADASQTISGGGSEPNFTSPGVALNGGGTDPLDTPIPLNANWDTDTAARQLRFRNNGKLHAAMVDGSARAFGKTELTYAQFVPNR
jgi:prepilin-type N-terminal cleavage/methylation domain-containing protein